MNEILEKKLNVLIIIYFNYIMIYQKYASKVI